MPSSIPRFVPSLPKAAPLLAWYDRHHRRLPWRVPPGSTAPGEAADPYRVWLSEIMLQQTTVTAVIPYYEAFLMRFPTVQALAAAPVEEVMAAWAGLGYYARARNLHACAKAVAALGGFPTDAEGLRALPGIGPYTATAIAAIAFNQPGVPIDGNVERVVARAFAITEPLPAAKPAVREAVSVLERNGGARARPADFAQALFDLGATICTPAKPACALCPWRGSCAGFAQGIAAALPRKTPKPERPHRNGVHFWLMDANGNVLLRRRRPSGLLGGMTVLPGTEWREARWTRAEALHLAPATADWHEAGTVRHGFTHFTLDIALYAARVRKITAEGFLRPIAALGDEALPSVMRKCVRQIIGGVNSLDPNAESWPKRSGGAARRPQRLGGRG